MPRSAWLACGAILPALAIGTILPASTPLVLMVLVVAALAGLGLGATRHPGQAAMACGAVTITCTLERVADCARTRFLRTMRLFHLRPLDRLESARIRSVQTRNRAAESEALGLRGPPL